jgi:hypothetical protein
LRGRNVLAIDVALFSSCFVSRPCVDV